MKIKWVNAYEAFWIVNTRYTLATNTITIINPDQRANEPLVILWHQGKGYW